MKRFIEIFITSVLYTLGFTIFITKNQVKGNRIYKYMCEVMNKI